MEKLKEAFAEAEKLLDQVGCKPPPVASYDACGINRPFQTMHD